MTKQDCFDKLNHIATLDKNWNGYDADPISDDIIEECKIIVNQLEVNPEIFPTANDSIQLEYQTDKFYIELEVFQNIYLLFTKVDDKIATLKSDCMEQVIQWWNLLTSL